MSTIEQSLELLTLKKVFAEGERSFIIPDYQRGYSWEQDQRKDLLKDIEYGMSGDYSHYTGTLVAVKKCSIRDNDRFEIVDGQQRLTTLIILLSCIAHAFKRMNTAVPEDLRRCFIEEGSERGSTLRNSPYQMIRIPFSGRRSTSPTPVEQLKTRGIKTLLTHLTSLRDG